MEQAKVKHALQLGSNAEFKAILVLVFDAVSLGKDAISKNYFGLMGDVSKMVLDLPAAISNFSDLQNEINALKDPAAQSDLIAFIETQFSAQIPSDKAQAILAASLKIVQDSVQVVQDAWVLKNLISG